MPHEADQGSPALTVRKVTKSFARTVAVSDVSFDLIAGEIVALLGENGAGKSTIIGVLAGLFGQEYEGHIELLGRPYRPESIAEAESNGIVLIAQEISVVPELTVAQSLFLNNEPRRWGLVDAIAMQQQAGEVLDEFGVSVDPRQAMGSLDLAHQQLVMIARALHKEARILILDEPTAALTGAEANRLFDRLRAYRDSGTVCLFVSHRLAEVFAIADRVLVLRDGALVGDHRTEQTSSSQIVDEMLGAGGKARHTATPLALKRASGFAVRGLTARSARSPGRAVVEDVTFEVSGGEIVGLFGLVGSGAGALANALFGAWPGQVTGEIEINGDAGPVASPEHAVSRGIGFVAQDRRDALVPIHSVAENIVMASLGRFRAGPFLDGPAVRDETRRRIAQLDIRVPDETSPVAALSGGNQQKVQVARWLVADTPILILDDPTRGVDVGARAEIHAILAGLAESGRALLLVSSDAAELVSVCSRILVMRAGRLTGEVSGPTTTEGQLIELASGFVLGSRS